MVALIHKNDIRDYEFDACPAHLEAAMHKLTNYLQLSLCICKGAMQDAKSYCNEKRSSTALKARAGRIGYLLNHSGGKSPASLESNTKHACYRVC